MSCVCAGTGVVRKAIMSSTPAQRLREDDPTASPDFDIVEEPCEYCLYREAARKAMSQASPIPFLSGKEDDGRPLSEWLEAFRPMGDDVIIAQGPDGRFLATGYKKGPGAEEYPTTRLLERVGVRRYIASNDFEGDRRRFAAQLEDRGFTPEEARQKAGLG